MMSTVTQAEQMEETPVATPDAQAVDETFVDTYVPPEPLEKLREQALELPTRLKHYQLRIRMLSEQLHILSANYQAGAGKIFSVLARELEVLTERLDATRLSGGGESKGATIEKALLELVDFLMACQQGRIDPDAEETQAKIGELQETLRFVLHEISQLLSQFNMVRIGIKMQAVRVGVTAFLDFGETLEHLYTDQLRPWLEALKTLRLKLDRHVYRLQFYKVEAVPVAAGVDAQAPEEMDPAGA